MKKDRNTFFTNYNAQSQNYIPNIPNNFGPYTSSQASTSYYAGPDINLSNEFDNRLSKLERQINRIDNRLSKLEGTLSKTTTTTIDENNYTNMYML